MATVAGVLALSGLWTGLARASDLSGYVANEGAGAITPVDLASGTTGTPIPVGSDPVAIAITPDGSTAYVADYGSSQVAVVSLVSGKVTNRIAVGDPPTGIAISASGQLAYVVSANGLLWPLTLADNVLGNPITVPTNSDAIALTDDARTAYLTNIADATVTPISLPGGGIGQPLNLSQSTPDAIALSGGDIAWTASSINGTISSLNLATGVSGTPIVAGSQASALVLSPDKTIAYVADYGSGTVLPITLATGKAGTPIPVGAQPSAIALEPGTGGMPVTGGGAGGTGGGTGGTGGGVGGGGLGGGGLSGASGGGAGGAAIGTVSVGNQRLSLSIGGQPDDPTTASAKQICRAPSGTLRLHVNRQRLRRGAHLHFRYALFSLGTQHRRVKRLPATVHLKLLGLRAGMHSVVVRVFYRETLAAVGHRGGVRLTLSRLLRERFRICPAGGPHRHPASCCGSRQVKRAGAPAHRHRRRCRKACRRRHSPPRR